INENDLDGEVVGGGAARDLVVQRRQAVALVVNGDHQRNHGRPFHQNNTAASINSATVHVNRSSSATSVARPRPTASSAASVRVCKYGSWNDSIFWKRRASRATSRLNTAGSSGTPSSATSARPSSTGCTSTPQPTGTDRSRPSSTSSACTANSSAASSAPAA